MGMPIEAANTLSNPFLYLLAAVIRTLLPHAFSTYDLQRLANLRDELEAVGLTAATPPNP